MDERVLLERLISYDSSTPEGIRSAGAFIKGWLESRDVDVLARENYGLPVIEATVGPQTGAPTVILHGHVDVVPGKQHQFEPVVQGDRLLGRGAYDMKGALAAMMWALVDMAAQQKVRVKLLCTPDEETEEVEVRSTNALVKAGFTGDFAITGEPTDLHIGVQAKGVLAMRIEVSGQAAHGSTPWQGDNAILKGIDIYRRIETLSFSRASSEMFDRPSINLGRISGGDALNKVPDQCTLDIDIRYLPEQDPAEILTEVKQLADIEIVKTFTRAPAVVSPTNPYVATLRKAVEHAISGEVLSVGRDGASDAIAFLEAGIPAVEFGPAGGGHHGPSEWVSISSLRRYRETLAKFITMVGMRDSNQEELVDQGGLA
jgi:succinyl-diaminopimelate desuccinylase